MCESRGERHVTEENRRGKGKAKNRTEQKKEIEIGIEIVPTEEEIPCFFPFIISCLFLHEEEVFCLFFLSLSRLPPF